jgi:hypothetical protein
MRPPDLLQLQTGAIGRCGYGFFKKKSKKRVLIGDPDVWNKGMTQTISNSK